MAENNVPAVPKKRGSKSASVEKTTTANPSEISQALTDILYWYDREIVKTDDECAERLNEFFRRVTVTGEIPTVEKLCLALGAARTTVWEWEQGKRGTVRSNMIKKAKEILAALDAELVSKGKIPQVTYIFRAKNYFGLKDQQEVVLTPNNPLGDQTSPEELQQKYLEAVATDRPETE